MDITVEGVLNAFVETGLKPRWASYGNGKDDGCGVTALALHRFGRLNDEEENKPDTMQLRQECGKREVVHFITGYEKGRSEASRDNTRRGELFTREHEVGFEVAERLDRNHNDARLALIELQAEGVRTEKASQSSDRELALAELVV